MGAKPLKSTKEKLNKTENRLRKVAGERESLRKKLIALEHVLAPRLRTLLTLRPIRHTLRRRQQVKAGLLEVSPEGVLVPKSDQNA